MKRSSTVLEPWTTKEKLCLSSAVLRSGDQNWMSVSRVLRVFGEEDRSSEYYSQKQCALQYELLLNNIGTTKRKKRSDKGIETVDTPCESIVRKLLQERQEELHQLLEEDRREYTRLLKEIEEIESGKADDRLDEFEREIEEEKEREAIGGSILRQVEERSRVDIPHVDSTEHHNNDPMESKVPTSPLLTSLLQSPSSFRGAASIHSLLSPNHRLNDSPTLSRLLESPAKQIEPKTLFPSYVKKEPVEEEASAPTPVHANKDTQPVTPIVEEKPTSETVTQDIKTEDFLDKEEEEEVNIKGDEAEFSEAEAATPVEYIEVTAEAKVDDVAPVLPSKTSTEEVIVEKEEQDQSSLNNLQDSDTMEEQNSITELDSQMVNMIVAGGGVISVSHDTSSEHLDVTSSDIHHKDDSEAADNSQEGVSSFVEIDEEINVEGAVLEVGGEMVNLGGAVVVEEEVDTTVHEVEVVVSDLNTSPSSSTKCIEEEDSTMDGEIKEQVEIEQDESQVDDEVDTPRTCSNEENEREEKDDEDRSQTDTEQQIIPKNVASSTNEVLTQPITEELVDHFSQMDLMNLETLVAKDQDQDSEEDGESVKQQTKLSLTTSSDSKPSSPATHVLEDSKEYRSWKKSIMLVFNRMATHKYASIFLRPITNEQAPAYDSVIQRPVDLSTIKKRIETGELRTTVDFQRDLLLMFQNAIMYNNCRTLVYEMANIMQNECMQHIELMVEAMGEGVPWRKDAAPVDKLHTRGRGEAPKRKRTSIEENKAVVTPKRRKDTSI